MMRKCNSHQGTFFSHRHETSESFMTPPLSLLAHILHLGRPLCHFCVHSLSRGLGRLAKPISYFPQECSGVPSSLQPTLPPDMLIRCSTDFLISPGGPSRVLHYYFLKKLLWGEFMYISFGCAASLLLHTAFLWLQ